MNDYRHIEAHPGRDTPDVDIAANSGVYRPTARFLTYDEFCSKVVEAVEESLDTPDDADDLVRFIDAVRDLDEELSPDMVEKMLPAISEGCDHVRQLEEADRLLLFNDRLYEEAAALAERMNLVAPASHVQMQPTYADHLLGLHAEHMDMGRARYVVFWSTSWTDGPWVLCHEPPPREPQERDDSLRGESEAAQGRRPASNRGVLGSNRMVRAGPWSELLGQHVMVKDYFASSQRCTSRRHVCTLQNGLFLNDEVQDPLGLHPLTMAVVGTSGEVEYKYVTTRRATFVDMLQRMMCANDGSVDQSSAVTTGELIQLARLYLLDREQV
jgi:hypothetical protein